MPTVVELKARLKRYGLLVSGKKADLLERLVSARAAEIRKRERRVNRRLRWDGLSEDGKRTAIRRFDDQVEAGLISKGVEKRLKKNPALRQAAHRRIRRRQIASLLYAEGKRRLAAPPQERALLFTDLDHVVPWPFPLPADVDWVPLLNVAKDEFEEDDAVAVYSTWMMERVDEAGEAEVLDCTMTDERAELLIHAFPEGVFLCRIKFIIYVDPVFDQNGAEVVAGHWRIEDKVDPIKEEERKGGGIVEFSRGMRPGALTGIDKPYYENDYPVTVVVYGLYPIREPDPANLAQLRDGDFNCVAKRVVEHFEGAQKGQGLTPARRQKIEEWEARVHEPGATIDDVAALERILKRAIILRDIAGEVIYSSRKYQASGWKSI